MASLMRVNDPVAVVALAHCQVTPVAPPSGSIRVAVSDAPTRGLADDSVTVPASSSLVTLMVTAMVAIAFLSPVPSFALTVTKYLFLRS